MRSRAGEDRRPTRAFSQEDDRHAVGVDDGQQNKQAKTNVKVAVWSVATRRPPRDDGVYHIVHGADAQNDQDEEEDAL